MTLTAEAQTTPNESFATRVAPETVRLERLLSGPVDRVWTWIIDSDKRAKWFAGGPIVLQDGGDATLTFRNSDLSGGLNASGNEVSGDGIDHVMHGIITRCEPPHVLAFNWNHDGSGSESTFELSPEGEDTRLVITHRRLSSHKQLLGVSAGWHTHVGILIDLLSQETPRRFWPEHGRLEKVYAERFED